MWRVSLKTWLYVSRRLSSAQYSVALKTKIFGGCTMRSTRWRFIKFSHVSRVRMLVPRWSRLFMKTIDFVVSRIKRGAFATWHGCRKRKLPRHSGYIRSGNIAEPASGPDFQSHQRSGDNLVLTLNGRVGHTIGITLTTPRGRNRLLFGRWAI